MNTQKKRRVVITGLGTVNPTGNTVAESWAAVKAGRCAVAPITAFDTADYKVKLAAEVKNFDPAERIDRREARKMARFTQFAVAAAEEAVRDSGLAVQDTERARFGVILSSGIGGLPTIEEEHARGQQRGAPTPSGMHFTGSGTATRIVCSAAAPKAASARWVWAALPL